MNESGPVVEYVLSNTFYHERGGETMGTNQIAAAVKSGQADVMTLWEAVRRFTHDRAYRWERALGSRCGVTVDDLTQTGFLALLDALETWKPEAGTFLTWYGLRLKAAFAAATGQRTQRDKRDPLQTCVSLDMPVAESEGDALTLADVLPDQTAEAAFKDVDERDRRQRLHHALHRALQTLPETQRRAVVLRYFCGCTVEGTAARMGTTRAAASAAEQKALRLLRHPMNSKKLRVYC